MIQSSRSGLIPRSHPEFDLWGHYLDLIVSHYSSPRIQLHEILSCFNILNIFGFNIFIDFFQYTSHLTIPQPLPTNLQSSAHAVQ